MAGTVVCVGLATLDVINYVAEYPGPNDKVQSEHALVHAGGPATNAAATVALLGYPVRLVTAIGTSATASIIRDDLAVLGVEVMDCAELDYRPALSSVVVTIPTGDRAVTSLNAAHSPAQAELPTGALDDAAVGLVDGHHLSLAVGFARACRDARVPVVMDGGSWKDGTEVLAPWVDIAVVSERFTVPEQSDPLEWLASQGVSHAIMTRGEHAVRWLHAGQETLISVPQRDTADTLGAGDVFHGAFAARLVGVTITKRRVAEALRFAIEIAGRSVESRGTRSWVEC